MAYEVKRKFKDSLIVEKKINSLTDRESYSQEINEEYGEGGGLNAGYDIVEAVAKYSNEQGKKGKEYGKDFIFKTTSYNEVMGDETVVFEHKA
jgi:hypothetical protein